MTDKKSPRAGEVRCLNCFERFYPQRGAERFTCPSCGIEWRISWTTTQVPKIRGPVWEKLYRKPAEK